MKSARQFQVSLYRHLAGDVVAIQVLRGGDTVQVPVAMAERHDPFGGVAGSGDPRDTRVPRVGILGAPLDERMPQALPVIRVASGVVVVSTEAKAIDARDGGL